ncbi:MAG: ABC transporter ATP-binding protein [Anaerolineae bacterium]|nr:ABC transporter ATP-binding protein [Anaerolineae bacterium]
MQAVQFEAVSKRFYLDRERSRSFQDMLLRVFRRSAYQPRQDFWALQDVSFEIASGETVGFIGANGVGKSSVLKLIARIIEPTSGQVTVNGHVSALLELGAGFHPDLTGRENIYLYGAVMGLDKAYIQRHFDGIVAFSELDRFIDVPIKHYSSGMYVRLGFSVAIHAAPAILLIDEVLAVGDQDFQRKCLRQIGALKQQGVTIVLVSHNLSDIETMCDRAIWLDEGRITADGKSMEVADQYRSFAHRRSYERERQEHPADPTITNRWGTQEAVITRVELINEAGEAVDTFRTGGILRVRLHYTAPELIHAPTFGLAIYRSDGLHINGPNSVREGYDIPFIHGVGYVDYTIPVLPLNAGEYQLTVAIYNRNSTVAFDHHHRQYPFVVLPPAYWREEGVIHIPARWEHVPDRPTPPEPGEPVL